MEYYHLAKKYSIKFVWVKATQKMYTITVAMKWPLSADGKIS
jgi:hypothetical protein